MKSLLVFLVFVGMFLIIQGIYEEKIKIAEQNTRVEYKFIPRTYYEEQLAKSDLSNQMADMFNYNDPWSSRVD